MCEEGLDFLGVVKLWRRSESAEREWCIESGEGADRQRLDVVVGEVRGLKEAAGKAGILTETAVGRDVDHEPRHLPCEQPAANASGDWQHLPWQSPKVPTRSTSVLDKAPSHPHVVPD